MGFAKVKLTPYRLQQLRDRQKFLSPSDIDQHFPRLPLRLVMVLVDNWDVSRMYSGMNSRR